MNFIDHIMVDKYMEWNELELLDKKHKADHRFNGAKVWSDTYTDESTWSWTEFWHQMVQQNGMPRGSPVEYMDQIQSTICFRNHYQTRDLGYLRPKWISCPILGNCTY